MKKVSFEELAKAYCERQVCEPNELKQRLLQQVEDFHPVGWMLLECQMLDSSSLGSLVILPFGPNNTFKEPPSHPVSPRGLASDMSTVIAVMDLDQLTGGE